MNDLQVNDARGWLKDSLEIFRDDIDEDFIDALTASQVEMAIKRHFDGGITGFLNSY